MHFPYQCDATTSDWAKGVIAMGLGFVLAEFVEPLNFCWQHKRSIIRWREGWALEISQLPLKCDRRGERQRCRRSADANRVLARR